MAQSPQHPGAASLEEQLRNLIVSNATRQQSVQQVRATDSHHHSAVPQQSRGQSGPHHPVPRHPHPSRSYGNAQSGQPGPHHGGRHPGDPRFQVDSNAYQRGPPRGAMQHRQPRQLYQPHHQPFAAPGGPYFDAQWHYLEGLVAREVPPIEMTADEIASKDRFRIRLEHICQSLNSDPANTDLPAVTLHSFGSLASGFATAGSDMDLAIVTDSGLVTEHHFSLHENNLPRALEKELLDQGIGARLLTRTRVPIIKICETPPLQLLSALREERQKWDALPEDEKYSSAKPSSNDVASNLVPTVLPTIVPAVLPTIVPKVDGAIEPAPAVVALNGMDQPNGPSQVAANAELEEIRTHVAPEAAQSKAIEIEDGSSAPPPQTIAAPIQSDQHAARQRRDKQWTRERIAGPLDFPKQGVGIQCDINFFNPLGIYNTRMLRCYSKCDSRVRPMVLFVKSWAKRRQINSSYSGTLSSYGFVLMVLHYLVNVAQPPVLPNLQLQAARFGAPTVEIDGWDVRFFNDEGEIESSAARGVLTQNFEPLGALLRGFFQYFASTSGGQGFIWMQDVLSLRTPGGIMKKEQKGWTGAKTEVGDHQKEVRHRYLFAIEDPFELAHNVARTVTHNGIVAIRDEFRRSWRIIQAEGRGQTPHDGDLFAEVQDGTEEIVPPGPRPVRSTPQPSKVATVQSTKPTAPQDYSEAFPQLGGPRTHAPPKVRPANSIPKDKQSAQARFPRQNQRQKSQPGLITGEQAMAHLKEYKQQQNRTNGSSVAATNDAK